MGGVWAGGSGARRTGLGSRVRGATHSRTADGLHALHMRHGRWFGCGCGVGDGAVKPFEIWCKGGECASSVVTHAITKMQKDERTEKTAQIRCIALRCVVRCESLESLACDVCMSINACS